MSIPKPPKKPIPPTDVVLSSAFLALNVS